MNKMITNLPFINKSESLERVFISVLKKLHLGDLTINLPSGNVYRVKGAGTPLNGETFNADWNLKSYRAIRRMLRDPAIGFAEGYMEDEWDSRNLTSFLELMAINMDTLESSIKNWKIVMLWNRFQHLLRSNTRRGSRKNISYHYDLGNDFYQLWLDSTMTYSSAVFDNEHEDLASGQFNKYKQIAEGLNLKPHHRVLEIGCGWGGFAEFAAKNYGCKIVGITISHEQLTWARDRIDSAGLTDLVEIRFQDYRDLEGKFDRIVSIEMFEAVGEDNWADYFNHVQQCLTDKGQAALQIISIENDRFHDYRNNPDFIQKYIFPGGMLPSDEILGDYIRNANLIKSNQINFGLSYAHTLKLWRSNFLKEWESISRLGYSNKFKRMWEYYFCYCEAGFRRGTIDVGCYFLTKRLDVGA
ncbi:MAG: cyclopropane-fatty-acyl-phospholipid synthase family protein [Pseudomonadota bacterium]|nr:cyclopropane-fatty-acyl-phospholipid synthase family protein [Pseudomonadota bacterium]